ncbi:MAG: glutamate dehydrogenase, partial [Actinomycetota bacterium]|nr:glutamate dehydrogenase [Actinomycetota bacterium]
LGVAGPVRVVISGYGNVGAGVAGLLLDDPRFAVVGISDVSGGVYDAKGLDIAAINAVLGGTGGTISGLSGELLTPGEMLEQPCDVLIPAAVGGVIDTGNASRIDARLVVEGANGPTTTAADLILGDRGVTVIPDILANAGGVIASHYEWAQGVQGVPWPAADMETRLRTHMEAAYTGVATFARDKQVSLRSAALAVGVGRVASAHRVRGLYP